eukprot:6185000-Pleurochrysis_carterae.AAC.1
MAGFRRPHRREGPACLGNVSEPVLSARVGEQRGSVCPPSVTLRSAPGGPRDAEMTNSSPASLQCMHT